MESKSLLTPPAGPAVRATVQRLFLFVLLLAAAAPVHGQMKTSSRFVYNHCGEKVVFRGIEHMLYWADTNGDMIGEIAKTGTNYIRLLLDVSITGPQLRTLMQKCVDQNRMYVSVAIWKPWLNQDFWARADVKSVLLDYENFIVIHGYGEAEFSDDYPRWVSEVKQIITKIRNAGYKCPIDAISTTYGRDPRPIIQYGQSLVDHDPLRNIILGCQMYWGTYYEGVYGMTIAQACAKFATLGFPVQVGACPSDCGNDCGQRAWDEAYKNQLGCMWWSWKGDQFELSSTGQYANLTASGQSICVTGQYSISKTSVKYGGSCPTTPPPVTLRTPENPASTVAGVEYRYYEGTWSVLPNFDALTAVKSGNVANFDMSVRNRTDNYGFRYTGFVQVPTDGTYTFYTSSDDGSKLYIGTTEVVNNDGLHALQERSGTIGLKAGKHAISVRFFESTGGEGLTVSYAGPGITKQAIPNAALSRAGTATAGTGLRGEYFNNRTLTAPSALVRTDATVNFQWWDPAGPGVTADNFSVRWTGQVEAPASGSYTFSTVSDDGVRLWVNGVQVVNNWTDHGETTNNGTPITLTGGQKYNITMEFYDATAGATARLLWAYPGQTQVVVPQARLFPASSARTAVPETAGLPAVSVYPNPTDGGYLHVKFVAAARGEARVSLVNALGRAAVQRAYPVAAGENTLRVPTAGLGEGIYVLHVQQAGRKLVRKVAVGK